MSEIVDAFQLQIQADEQVTATLNNIAKEASKGVTVGVHMDADVTGVLNAIDKVAKELQTKVANGTFDFNDLFNLKSSIAQLGGLAEKFQELTPIFNSLNTGANTLGTSMTQIASLKLEAGQFQSLQTSLSNIDQTISNIASKLGVVNSADAFEGVEQGARDAAQATEELAKVKENADAKMHAAAKESGQAQVASGEKILANYDQIIERLNKIAELRKIVNNGDQFLLPEYSNGYLQAGAYIDGNDIRSNQITKTAIRRHLSDYNQYQDDHYLDQLTACVAAYKNLDEAQSLFGKKNQETWDKVVAKIEAAKAAKKAYKEIDFAENGLLRDAKNGQDIKWTYGDSDKLMEQLNTGNIQGALDMLTERFGVVKQEAANTAANVEKVEHNLTDAANQAEVLEHQMADVNAKSTQSATGKVDNGGQLALEKTLKATYHIQQNMVKIMSEINAKMVSGADAATASYEQLRAVMQETVEASKQLGAEETKRSTKKADDKSKERYAIMKKDLNEIIKLKKLLPNAGESEKQEITRQIKALNEQVRSRQKNIDKANAQIAVEQKEVDLLRERVKLINAQNRDKRKSATGSANSKQLENAYNSTSKILRTVGNGSPLIGTVDGQNIQGLIDKFKQYAVWLDVVDNKFENLSNNQQAEIKESIAEFNKLSQAQKDALKGGGYNSFNNKGDYKGKFIPLDESQLNMLSTATAGTEQYKAALMNVTEKAVGFKLESAELDNTGTKLVARYRDQARNLQEVTVGYQQAGQGARIFQKQVEAHQGVIRSVFEPFGNKLKEIFRYFSAYTLIMRFFNAIKNGINTVKELNTAYTELKVVTGETNAAIEKFSKNAQVVAENIASTTIEVTQSATEWARLGYTMSDSLELAAEAAKYAKVGFTDIDTATQNLTSTLQAFYADDIRKGIISAGDAAAEITDKLVYVGNKFASSAEGMGGGITAAGAALVAANNSLDESLAMITAGTTILQDEDETANALRTISMRLRGTKASELEDAGLETDGVVEDASKLYDLVKKMTSVNGGKGVEILDVDTGAYKSTYQILLEISEVWDKLNDQQQAGLLEALAGKTRANAASAILSNGEILKEAYDASVNSYGEADKAMEETLNSIESHIAKLNQAISVMWENTLDSGVVKFFVDLGTSIVKLTDKVGLFSVALSGIAGYFGAKGQGRHTKQRVFFKYA